MSSWFQCEELRQHRAQSSRKVQPSPCNRDSAGSVKNRSEAQGTGKPFKKLSLLSNWAEPGIGKALEKNYLYRMLWLNNCYKWQNLLSERNTVKFSLKYLRSMYLSALTPFYTTLPGKQGRKNRKRKEKREKSHAHETQASCILLKPCTTCYKLSFASVNEFPSPNKDENRGQDTNVKQDILNHPAPSFISSLSPSALPGSHSIRSAHS